MVCFRSIFINFLQRVVYDVIDIFDIYYFPTPRIFKYGSILIYFLTGNTAISAFCEVVRQVEWLVA